MRTANFESNGPFGSLLLEKLENLDKENDLVSTMLNRVGALIVVLDQRGAITHFNQACERISGLSAQDVKGCFFWEIASDKSESERIEKAISELRHGKTSTTHENTWISLDGKRHQIAWSNAVLIGQGQVKYMISTGIDITDQLQTKKEEAEQRSLAEALAETAAIINKTLNLDDVLDRVLENLRRVVDHDLACIFFIQDGVARVVRHQSYIQPVMDMPLCFLEIQFRIDVFKNLQEISEKKGPVIVNDSRVAGEGKPLYTWLRSNVGVPIIFEKEVLGIITLDSEEKDHFNEKSANQLQAFADQAAIAIQNARLYSELESYSSFLEQAVEDRTAELKRIKERVETILNNSPDPVVLLDKEGRIEMGNPAFQQMFGYEADEIFNENITRIAAPAASEPLREAISGVSSERETRRVALIAIRKNEENFDSELALAPIIENSTLLGIVCTIRDISEMKEITRMKDSFVSNVSHELRTPITSLRLNQHLARINPENSDIYLNRLAREIDRLDNLIDDLLRLSHLDQGRVVLALREVNLNALISQMIQDRSPLAENLQLSLIFTPDPDLPLFEGDEGLLNQSLSVLLSNALNYTPPSGTITVSTQQRQIEASRWVGFSVHDTGPGIAPDEQQRIFERFYRGQAGRDSGVPGTGLGLVIADEIVKRHGGTFEVQSKGIPGEGATFTIWIPVET